MPGPGNVDENESWEVYCFNLTKLYIVKVPSRYSYMLVLLLASSEMLLSKFSSR